MLFISLKNSFRSQDAKYNIQQAKYFLSKVMQKMRQGKLVSDLFLLLKKA